MVLAVFFKHGDRVKCGKEKAMVSISLKMESTMKKNYTSYFFCLLFLTLLCFLIPRPVKSTTQEPDRVLLISSYHPGFPTFFRQIKGIQSIFSPKNILFDVEFMDSKRFADSENEQNFLHLLSYKLHHAKPYDVVMTADDNALTFVQKHREELFPNKPVVFFGVNNIAKARVQNNNSDITGVVEAVSMNDTIEMMVGFQPQAKNIVALVDTTPSGQGDLIKFKWARYDFPELTFSTLSLGDYSFSEFAAELGKLGDDTAILLLSAYADKDGKRLSFQDSLDLILKNLSQPLFHLWYHGIGQGILGGKVISHEQQGKTAAQIVVRILEGEPVGHIRVDDDSPNKYILDYRILQKFRLDKHKYPPDTLLLHKPVSLFSQYKLRILLVFAFLFFQTAIILFLINTIITKKRAESALRDSEKRYFSLFAENHSVMMLIDPETGLIVDTNSAACSYYGYPFEKMVGMKASEINLLSEEEIHAEMEKAQSEKRSYYIFQHRIASGDIRDVEVYSGPISLHGRQLLYLIVHDITERIRLETQLRQAQKIEAVGNLAGGIAHDFNNILFAITGYTELVQSNIPADSSVQNYLDQIIVAGNRAAGLVQQILTYSRKTKHDLQPVTPHFLIREVLKMLHPSLPATIMIQEEIDEKCGEILADPSCIYQIIMNLCTNGLHAMENQKGTLTIKLYYKELGAKEVRAKGGVEAGAFVVMSVGDTGCGMDRATVDRIYDPFFTTKGIGQGSGMGLAVVHGIVEDLKGFIEVESMPGGGSVFKIYIPALLEKTAETEDLVPGKFRIDIPPPTGFERILVVDDEPQLVEIQKVMLEQSGYSVTETTDSTEALKLFQEHPDRFDLLITDLTMPGLGGDALSRAVLEVKPDIPIIMCTGHSDIVSERESLSMGIKQFISKPVYKSEFLATVRRVLDGEQR